MHMHRAINENYDKHPRRIIIDKIALPYSVNIHIIDISNVDIHHYSVDVLL